MGHQDLSRCHIPRIPLDHLTFQDHLILWSTGQYEDCQQTESTKTNITSEYWNFQVTYSHAFPPTEFKQRKTETYHSLDFLLLWAVKVTRTSCSSPVRRSSSSGFTIKQLSPSLLCKYKSTHSLRTHLLK